jgi:hypothetical protein
MDQKVIAAEAEQAGQVLDQTIGHATPGHSAETRTRVLPIFNCVSPPPLGGHPTFFHWSIGVGAGQSRPWRGAYLKWCVS